MDFVANHDLDIRKLLNSLNCINKTDFKNDRELYGRYVKQYNLQAIHLSAFMLKVLPLIPRDDEYWSNLAITITGGISDVNFKNETVKILKNTWNKYKKEVLQNLYRCKLLVDDADVHSSIENLLKSFSKHWLDLPNVTHLNEWVNKVNQEKISGICTYAFLY